MAVSDDYKAYKKGEQDTRFGKPLLLDQADYTTQHIFFDDNAEEGHACVVDVRDVITGEKIPYSKFINKYVVQVESHRAVLEQDYFIKMIELAEGERDKEIERVEMGLEEGETIEKPTEMTWEELQRTPNEEYLMKTVLPVLYQGMRAVDLERPICPLEFLALYLLKNQDKVKLPPKPTIPAGAASE